MHEVAVAPTVIEVPANAISDLKMVATNSSDQLLRVDGVTVRFGGITALDKVSFSVTAGHIVGLIGPNGAGKTTLFNCLSRLYSFSEGTILFEGRSIVELPPHCIAAMGIGRTFQNLALFRTMTVRQNIMLGGHCRTDTGFFANALRLPQVRREERALQDHADLQFIPNVADQISKAAPSAIYGVFLIVFMYVMPTGVAGFIRIVSGRLQRRR